MQRPNFKDIKSYNEFVKFYWYREELKKICKDIGIDYTGSKMELNHNIKEYFDGNIVMPKKIVRKTKTVVAELSLNTRLVECGFCFNQKFRNFFIHETGNANFKFNADMVATAKKVKQDNDLDFTLKDMLDVYYGKLEYAKYDNSSCEWNKFLKDFCADASSAKFSNKLKVASILWAEIRNSTNAKIYTTDLIETHYDMIKRHENSKL